MSVARVETWRLSRIEEELQNLDFTSEMEDDLPPPPPEFIADLRLEQDREYQRTISSGSLGSDPPSARIYSEALVGFDAVAKQEELLRKEGLKRLTDKYSKPNISESSLSSSPHTISSSPHIVSGAAPDFPPAPETGVYVVPPCDVVPQGAQQQLPQHGHIYHAHGQCRPQVLGGPHPQQIVSNPSQGIPSTAPVQHIQHSCCLTEQEVDKLKKFFGSLHTEVFICQCNVKLFFGYVHERPEQWPFVQHGALVMVLDKDDGRRQQGLWITLADKNTGFVIWRDCINHLSQFASIHPNFHVMHTSQNHNKMAGFIYDNADAAMIFFKQFHLIVQAHRHILDLSIKYKKKKNKTKYKAPSKSEISTPVGFTHVSRLERPENAVSQVSCNTPSPQHHPHSS